MINILDIIDYVKPTALFGLSTITVIMPTFSNMSQSIQYFHRMLLLPMSLDRWRLSTVAQSSSLYLTLSDFQNARLQTLWSTRKALYFSPQVLRSLSNSTWVNYGILDREITCIFSLVRFCLSPYFSDSPYLLACMFRVGTRCDSCPHLSNN